jgi:hypothetical protein
LWSLEQCYKLLFRTVTNSNGQPDSTDYSLRLGASEGRFEVSTVHKYLFAFLLASVIPLTACSSLLRRGSSRPVSEIPWELFNRVEWDETGHSGSTKEIYQNETNSGSIKLIDLNIYFSKFGYWNK